MRKLLLLVLLLPTLAFADDAKRRAIESNLATPVIIEGVRGKSLEQRMRELGVPAVSYAVVEDGKIVLASAVGLADIASQREATTATMFQAASISKPVSAIGVMDLVERGKLSLDAPVNSILRTWQLPENELTTKTPVSIRFLLSHTAGTTVHGFPGYASDEPRPSLVQVLNGAAPANTAPIVVDLAPNTKWRYSGGGTTVVQAAVVDATGLTFPAFMQRTVLGPLRMTNSTYEQPLPRARRAQAATAYQIGAREVDGKWHIYPEMAAAGLWTTPTDLAKVIVEMHDALAGRPTNVLTIDGARHMITPRMPGGGAGSAIGIGFFVEDRNGVKYFGHGGANEGFRATLLASLDGKRGAVVMTNSDTGAGVANEVLESIAREFEWPGYAKTPLRPVTVTDAIAERFIGRYEMSTGQIVNIRRGAEGLEFLDQTGWLPLYVLANGRGVRITRDTQFEPSAEGLTVIARASSPNPSRIVAKRLPAEPLRGIELLSMGRIDDAVAAYRNEKPSTDDLSDAAFGFFTSGRMQEGLALVRLNAELHPQSARAHDQLAEVLLISGDAAGAIAASEEALRRIDTDEKLTAAQKDSVRRASNRRLSKLRR